MKPLLYSALAAILITPSFASADVTDDDIQELRDQLATLSARLEELAAENAELKASQQESKTAIAAVETKVADAPAFAPSADSWTDRIVLDGDFRYRYERISVEGDPTRKRNRIRARTNIRAEVADNIDVVFGLATGGDDPVSANQTLGGGGSSKPIQLNLAYVDWQPTDGLNLVAGKFKNPLIRVGGQGLSWDSDWTPEGFTVKYSRDWFFVNALGTFLEGDSRSSNDNFSWGGQVGARVALGDVSLRGGIGYITIPSRGEQTTFGDPGDPGDYFGNTAVEAGGAACGTTGADCFFLYDYDLAQVFGEASFDVGEWPMEVFFDYVRNNDASDNDTAWTIGANLGEAKDRGQMEFSYYYAEKEADSVLGLLTDSNFGGGGTDARGHVLQFYYGLSKNWTIGGRYFVNEAELASGNDSDYDRVMIDIQWKWK
jgi:hypothetical protein